MKNWLLKQFPVLDFISRLIHDTIGLSRISNGGIFHGIHQYKRSCRETQETAHRKISRRYDSPGYQTYERQFISLSFVIALLTTPVLDILQYDFLLYAPHRLPIPISLVPTASSSGSLAVFIVSISPLRNVRRQAHYKTTSEEFFLARCGIPGLITLHPTMQTPAHLPSSYNYKKNV